MKVFIYENPSTLNDWFNCPDYAIPFLATNLLNFNTMGFLRMSNDNRDSIQLFLPSSWSEDIEGTDLINFYDGFIVEELEKHQKQEYELVFIMSLYSLFIGDFDRADISHLKQNPEHFYLNRGVLGGYLKKGQQLPQPEEFVGFNCFVQLTDKNFLTLNQDLTDNLTLPSVDTEARLYGKPTVLTSDISPDSVICAPAYIGKDVVINNSYIGPGTIIRGHSRVEGSKVFGSFLNYTTAHQVEISDVISSGGYLESVKLQNSIIPDGGVIVNVG